MISVRLMQAACGFQGSTRLARAGGTRVLEAAERSGGLLFADIDVIILLVSFRKCNVGIVQYMT